MAKNWNAYKPVIVRLYQTEGMTLDQVREIMAREYKFNAATRTYRMRFKKWKVRKYRKHTEDSPSLYRRSHHHRPSPSANAPASIPDLGVEPIPAAQFQHPHLDNPYTFPKRSHGPRPDTLDVFPTWWQDRSPSVSAASDYSSASVYDGRAVGVFPVPALRDGGHSPGRPPSISAPASATSDYSGASVHERAAESVFAVPSLSDGAYSPGPERAAESVFAIPSLSDGAYSPGPEQRMERDLAFLCPMEVWDGSGVPGSRARDGGKRGRMQ